MLQRNSTAKIEMNQILKKKENMENLLQNFWTTGNITEEIEAAVEMTAEMVTQKVVNKVHLPDMRRKTVQVKNGLHLMNKGSFQNICLREDKDLASLYKENIKKISKYQVGELWVTKQRPRNNQTMINGNEHYDTIIFSETQDSQMPTNDEQENRNTNDRFLLYG